MTNPQIAIDIVAKDQTAKGVGSAEKRIGRLGKGGPGGGLGNLARTFGEVDKAASKAFGNRSAFGGIGERMGAVGKIGSAFNAGLGRTAASLGRTAAAAGEAEAGLGSAATAAEGLGTAMGGLAIVGATAVAVVGAVAVAAYKLASGWADNAASMGRFATTMGLGTKSLQEFQGAAERLGIDKDTASGALGGLSQTLNDARYGRNNQAMAVLMRLGVKLKTNADGTVDTDAMLPDIANALARQNSSGRRTTAGALGIPLAALPAFAQGGAALTKDMSDIDRHGVMNGDQDVANAQHFVRDRAMISQSAERVKSKAVASGVNAGLGLMDGAASGAQSVADGSAGRKIAAAIESGAASLGRSITNDFVPAAGKILTAANTLFQAAVVSARDGVGAVTLSGNNKEKAAQARDFFEKKGWTAAQASGIVASLFRESRLDSTSVGDSGQAYGLGQWHPDRQANFRKLFGHDIRRGTMGEQLSFVDWELRNTEAGAGSHLKRASNAYDAGSAISRFYERPKDREGEAALRGGLAEQFSRLPEVPVHVVVELKGNVPKGTTATATAGRSKAPAISHAIEH